jgi:hypothetical protein
VHFCEDTPYILLLNVQLSHDPRNVLHAGGTCAELRAFDPITCIAAETAAILSALWPITLPDKLKGAE